MAYTPKMLKVSPGSSQNQHLHENMFGKTGGKRKASESSDLPTVDEEIDRLQKKIRLGTTHTELYKTRARETEARVEYTESCIRLIQSRIRLEKICNLEKANRSSSSQAKQGRPSNPDLLVPRTEQASPGTVRGSSHAKSLN